MRSKHRNLRKQGKIWEKHLEKSFYASYFQRNHGKLSITEKLIKYRRRVLKVSFLSSMFSFNVFSHLSRNSGSKRANKPMYVNKPIYVIARYTRWLIKEAKKCEQLSRFFLRNGKFHVERDACGRNVDGKIVVLLSSVVYYFGDLLKSANMAFVRHKTFIGLWFVYRS